MRILLWHVHGGWTDAFVRGQHEYLLPRTPQGGPWGLGRAGRDWPRAADADPALLRHADIDLVVLQRPEELPIVTELLGRRPGSEVPAIYVEHNTPRAQVPDTVHPLADRDDILLVHVTPFNALMWENGHAPVRVIEHGLPDPGHLYSGRIPHLAFVGNEPARRSRVLGADLLPRFAEAAPVDVFGMGAESLPSALGLGPDRLTVLGDLPAGGPDGLHSQLAERRAYLHPVRWTSLGLSLIEAMLIGMPVLVLATAQAAISIPDEAGAVSLDIESLVRHARRFVDDPELARECGRAARRVALDRFGLARFLADWDEAIDDAVVLASHHPTSLHRSRRENTP